MPTIHWADIGKEFLLDVRNPPELAVEGVPGAVNIPLPELRSRLGELPKDKEILIFCRSGQRAYYATRLLMQRGYKVRNIAGGDAVSVDPDAERQLTQKPWSSSTS
jgi:rhodanese-related sulfurtransferase